MRAAELLTPANFLAACVAFQAATLLYTVRVMGRVAASNKRKRIRIDRLLLEDDGAEAGQLASFEQETRACE